MSGVQVASSVPVYHSTAVIESAAAPKAAQMLAEEEDAAAANDAPPTNFFVNSEGLNKNRDEFEALVLELKPALAQMVVAPHAEARPLEGAPAMVAHFTAIDDAFDDAALRSAAVEGANRAKVSRSESLSGKLLPRGFVAKVNGDMPIETRKQMHHVLGAYNAGLGTSLYEVSALPKQYRAGGEDETIKQALEKKKEQLPNLLGPDERVALVRKSNQLGGDQYALLVTATDVPAAARLWTYAGAAAAADQPLTVHALAQSDEYKTLHERAQCARDRIAKTFASALRIKLANDGEAEHTTPHYALTKSTALAHNTSHIGQIKAAGSYAPNVYVIYHDASPTANSTANPTVLRHGLMGGATVLSNAERGKQSWTSPSWLSSLPSQTAAMRDGGEPVDTALHRQRDARTRSAFDARVVWHSDAPAGVGATAEVHPLADEVRASLADPFSQHWLNAMAADNKLEREQYHFVAGQLPDVSHTRASLADLAAQVRRADAPATVVVSLSHPLVARIPYLWDDVVKPSGYPASLDDVFANQFSERSDDGFNALERETACTNAKHAHSAASARAQDNADESSSGALTLYADAEKFNISPITGKYVGRVASGSDASDTASLEALRARHAAKRSVASVPRTYIKLDSELVRLLTE